MQHNCKSFLLWLVFQMGTTIGSLWLNRFKLPKQWLNLQEKQLMCSLLCFSLFCADVFFSFEQPLTKIIFTDFCNFRGNHHANSCGGDIIYKSALKKCKNKIKEILGAINTHLTGSQSWRPAVLVGPGDQKTSWMTSFQDLKRFKCLFHFTWPYKMHFLSINRHVSEQRLHTSASVKAKSADT